MTTDIRAAAEAEAIATFLSMGDDIPKSILELVEADWDDILVWEPFENWDRHELIEQIELTADSLTALLTRFTPGLVDEQIIADALGFEGDASDEEARGEHIIDLADQGIYDDLNNLVDLIETTIKLARVTVIEAAAE